MKRETRKRIANLSQKIDNIEATRKLISTSNVLCFTTMDRGADETVTIEFTEHDPDGSYITTNTIFKRAKEDMALYLDGKIKKLEKAIDEIIELEKNE